MSQKFSNILLDASLLSVYLMTEAVQAVAGTCYVWQYYGNWSNDMFALLHMLFER